MVDVKSLSLTLGNRQILQDISFTLKEGHVTVLLGPNGSGKTTLLRVLSSYFRNYDGHVCLQGKELKTVPDKERAGLHAMLSQQLPPVRFTLEELLAFGNGEADAVADLGLEHLKGKWLDEMSGGERSLSYLGLLYRQKADLYLMDEPDSALDPKARKVLEKAIGALRGRGACCLVSMHDLNRAMSIADDILVLDEGRIAFFGSKEQFLQTSIPETLFGQKPHLLHDEEGKSFPLFL